MHLTQAHLDTFSHDGFVYIEQFFSSEEITAAREAFFQHVAPPHHRRTDTMAAMPPARRLFPWTDPALNRLVVHPDLMAAAERIIGTRAIRLCDALVAIRYPGDSTGEWFHDDHGNNTLGPPLPNDRSNIVCFVLLTDVCSDTAPLQMVPHGCTDAEAVPFIAPAGSLCIYSAISTRHSASPFTGSSGERVIASICYSRTDRPWDGGRTFTYKGGADAEGMARFLADATPRQREMLGFPAPGDALWTDVFLAGMARRYPGFDVEPYRSARQTSCVVDQPLAVRG